MSGILIISFPKVLIALGILVLLLFAFNILIMKLLKVESPKAFSYIYVNERHKKLDRIIRFSTAFLVAISLFVTISNDRFDNTVWYYIPWIVLFASIIVSSLIKAYMEWKHEENPRSYLVTIFSLIFSLFILWITFFTNFFPSLLGS